MQKFLRCLFIIFICFAGPGLVLADGSSEPNPSFPCEDSDQNPGGDRCENEPVPEDDNEGESGGGCGYGEEGKVNGGGKNPNVDPCNQA